MSAPAMLSPALLTLALLSLAAPAWGQATPPSGSNENKIDLKRTDTSTAAAPPAREREKKEVEPHSGVFVHWDLGLGYGFVLDGALGPEPGFRPIDDLSFSGPVLGTSFQLGGGARDFSVAGELSYEVMLTDKEKPDNVGFQMFGIGLGANYYTDDDILIGAQLRYLGMILWRENIPCFCDRPIGTAGPGIGLTLGKEWYDRDIHSNHERERREKGGLGLALQGNYAAFQSDPDLHYASLLLELSMTAF